MKLHTLLMILAASAYSLADDSNPSVPPAREQFDLYLLIGQSNMAGRGKPDAESKAPNPRVLKFTGENTWAPGVDPLNFYRPGKEGVGLGTTFGRVMAAADPNVTIGLVQCAVGGTPLERWQKGGDLYGRAVTRARLAMKDGTLKGILWHHGENDSHKEETARTYGDRLVRMVADLRADLGAGDVPFLAGKIGPSLDLYKGNERGRMEFWKLVNEQIDNLPGRIPNSAVVESDGLTDIGDHVHYDSPSLRVFGKRYAAAMLQLKKNTSLPP